MIKKYKAMGCVLSILMISPMLNGCVVLALAPTALTFAAEGMSVNMTGQTITENIRDAINESKKEKEVKKVVKRTPAPLPPRKPKYVKPDDQLAKLQITTPPSSVGVFFKIAK